MRAFETTSRLVRDGRAVATSFLLLGVVLGGEAAAAGQVHRVESGGAPGTFATIGAALAAAADGDVVVVATSIAESAAVDLSQRSITLLGERDVIGNGPRIRGLRVANLTASQRVVVRGFDILAPILVGAGVLVALDDNLGPVLIEDCLVDQNVPAFGVLTEAVDATNCAAVTIVRCTLIGGAGIGDGLSTGAPGFAGLRCAGSKVGAYDSSVLGGGGTDAVALLTQRLFAGTGGPGVQVSGGDLYLSGCSVAGGAGGAGVAGTTGCAHTGGDAGDGLVLNGGVVRVRDSAITGGLAGSNPAGCAMSPVDGVDVVVGAGTFLPLSDSARSLNMTSPAYQGQPGTLTVDGEPGEFAALLIFPGVLGVYTPLGFLSGAGAALFIPLGVLDAQGTRSFTFVIPSNGLPTGCEGLDLVDQGVVAGAGGFGILTSPSLVTIVGGG